MEAVVLVCSACLHVWRLSCVVDSCNVVATEHGKYGLSCTYVECWVCIACQSVSYVVKFYYCWIWQIWIIFYVNNCRESNAECRFHLVG